LIELNNFYISESVTFMRNNIPDNFVDLTVTSPPYDDLRKYNGFIFDYQNMFKELYRVTKDGGVVVWVVGDKTEKGSETGTSFKHALYAKEIGFNLHDTMIYAKNNYIPLTHNRYEQQFEYMFVFSKNKPKVFNPLKILCKTAGMKNNHKSEKHYEDTHSMRKRNENVFVNEYKYKPNIWFYNTGTKDRVKHNAPFPQELAEDHILTWSNENDIILDPMCGSGTTCKMAWLNKRDFIGIDMSEEYINIDCIPRLNTYGWEQNQKIAFQECL